jgi:putative addiction module component (TIGR02574 family)
MTRAIKIPPPGFDDLPVDDQIEYVQSLWERIAADPSKVPVPDWHREILDKRLKTYDEQPNDGDTWDQVREEIERKLPDRATDK